MELDNNKPFFCDRDGIKKYSLAEIGPERRNGYAWYISTPEKVLKKYPKWKEKYGITATKTPTEDSSKLEARPLSPFSNSTSSPDFTLFKP